MSFIVIDDVSVASNRICFYFSFKNNEVIFASKRVLNGSIDQIKSDSLHDVLAWIGFEQLGFALFTSPRFSKKYRNTILQVSQHLYVNTINEDTAYYFKHKNEDDWQWTYDIEDILIIFGDSITSDINQLMGANFCKKHAETLALQKKISSDLTQSASELKAMNEKILEEKKKNQAKSENTENQNEITH